MRRETQGRLGALLEEGGRALNLDLSSTVLACMLDYLTELQKWNTAYNLTAIRDPEEMVTRHLLDSLSVLPFLSASRLIDTGAGAGLPGIPLALARPDLQISLLDGNGKKARFLRHAVRTLKLDKVTVVEARAEEFHPPALFDAVISRAYGPLAIFLRQTAHLATRGGQWLAMKGKLDQSELKNIPPEFEIVEIKPLAVPGLNQERHLIIASRLTPHSSRFS